MRMSIGKTRLAKGGQKKEGKKEKEGEDDERGPTDQPNKRQSLY